MNGRASVLFPTPSSLHVDVVRELQTNGDIRTEMNDTATLTKKCGSCQLYGVIDGGDIVPYGSTTARLPEYCGCMKEYDGNESGEPVDTSNCEHYKELPRCPRHPKEYVTYRGGCAECENDFYRSKQ